MPEWFFDAYIEGVPVSQGSMRHVGRGRMIHSTALIDWRKTVQKYVTEWAGTYFGTWEPVEGAVELHVRFYLPQAKSNKDTHPTGPRSKDCDKLVRAIGDSISLGGARLIADDSQIVDIDAAKRWAHGLPPEDGCAPGARIKLRRIE